MTAAPPRVVAHRGNSEVAPQNTLAAFEAARRSGAHGVELDVRLTADGQAVVIHDDTVDATTDGTGALDRMSLDQVRALDAGRWFAPAFTGQRVPTFAEVADLLSGWPEVDLLLELKGVWSAEQVRPLLETAVAAGLRERTVGQSFWPETVEALREADPGLRRGLLVLAADDDLLARCAALDVEMCNPIGSMLEHEPDLVRRFHEAGLRTAVWTLNEPAQWEAAVRLGVDQIITDRPDRLAGWLAGRSAAAMV
ncbi:glycerophosphodiester phosphodiesterase [Isoptericola croceus]|uniref:glycerophosphodiester phosphodiesterase n=1 Tax=Isoptericola croceus TaxID=3031406 RepID=UPI0023F6F9B2|nr:glycerophosphodiester phosphodiesterase family protein [Isoptericola croceus]